MEHPSDYSRLLRLAQTDAGQQLLQLLRQNGSSALEQAMASAASGDYRQAKALLGTLMSDPQAQKLIKTLEESL